MWQALASEAYMRSASARWTAALGDFVVHHRVAIIALSAAATALAAVVGCCKGLGFMNYRFRV
jgi:hypothetical protein